MENHGALVVDIAFAIRMMIPMCENVKCQIGNCMVLASHLKLLKQLFDELRQSKYPLSSNTVSAFELLQLTLQRAKNVLGTCANGSKIYSVLRSPQTLAQFLELNREIERILSASSLVLPRVSKHCQYMAEKCVLELKRATYSKDMLEEQIRQEIETLLMDHRSGKKASHEKLQNLAGYLRINTKEEIASELNALEKARSEARANKDKIEEDYVDQIISLFMQLATEDDIDNFDNGDAAKAEKQEVQIPADFRCPLSLELMYDPVIVASGQTYERAYIQHWLDQGNTRCPKTGKPIAQANLIPNYTVKAWIASWCQTHDVPLPKVDAVKSSNWLPPTVFSDAQSESRRSDAFTIDGGGEAETPRSLAEVHETEDRNDADDELRASTAAATRSSSNNFDSGEVGSVDVNRSTEAREIQAPAISIMTRRSSSYYSGDLSEVLGLSPSRNSPDHFPIFTRQKTQPKQDRKSYKSVYVEKDKQAEAGIERLVQDLQSADPGVQRDAAAELRLVAKISTEDRIRIAHAGGIKYLVALLSSPDVKTQENAVTALLNLSLNNNNKAEIAEAGAIVPLIQVLTAGTREAKENAAATLFSLSVKEDYKEAIGAHGAIPPLVDLLRTGSPRGKKDAATALYNLSLFHDNKLRIVAAGAVRPLIDLICEPRMGMVDRAVVVLATLSSIPEGRTAIGEEGGIPPLVEVVEAGSSLSKENAAAALFQLCSCNPRYRNATLQEGALPPLYILSQMGTPRAKEKAAGILRLFREQRQATMSRHPGSRHLG